MKNNNYKILVLSDLKDLTETTLKSTVSLAKMINGQIEFLHVEKPTAIVNRENQLSAMREINEKYNIIDKQIQSIVTPISKNYSININYSFSFGNVKTEIEKCINATQPDIIVIGKRKPKPFNLFGDSITQFILEKHKGAIMISADTNPLEPDEELSLGVLNGGEKTLNIAFSEKLISYSQKPLKSFKIIKNSDISNKVRSLNNNKTVEYAFEHSDNAINNLNKYIHINKINLLFVDRLYKKGNKKTKKANLQNVMDNLNTSLFIGEK